jgi:hypothetical protein
MPTTNTTGMSHLQIKNASQGYIHKYKNLKRKLYNCSANIYFNQTCVQKKKEKKLTPKYAKIKVANTLPASKYTQHEVPKTRIKDENKYLHTKRQQLH